MSKTSLENFCQNDMSYQSGDHSAANHEKQNNKDATDSCEESSSVNTKESRKNCLCRCLDRQRLEIASFLFMFSWNMIQISSTSMILEKVCLVHFNYSEKICSNLDKNYTDIKSAVEQQATNYQLIRTLIQTAPAIVISCFVAPWSDQYGRKVPVLIALTGMIFDTLLSSTCAFYLHSRVEYYYIPAIFTGFCGGQVTILTIIYSYASDVTPEVGRTMKYAFLEMALGLSQPLGIGAGGWIYKFAGYPAVFLISAAGLVVCFIVVAFCLPESRGLENYDGLGTKLKNLFTLETLKEGFNAAVKQRPNQGRKQILLLITAMCFIAIATKSTGDVSYYFAHHQFSWDNTTYSTVVTIYSVVTMLLLIIIVPIMKRFRLGDAPLGLAGTISALLKYLGIGLSFKLAIYHIANVLGSLAACASLAGRSRISKLVPNEDLAKVFSFVATAEAFFPVLTTALIAKAFSAFIDTYPGLPFIILAICLIPSIAVFLWMVCLPKTSNEYGNMDKEANGEESKTS